MAAWLQIPGTVIDYPVMWTPRDEEYYLYRDFDGSRNQNGCLILDTDEVIKLFLSISLKKLIEFKHLVRYRYLPLQTPDAEQQN